jgi:hypothetical protein
MAVHSRLEPSAHSTVKSANVLYQEATSGVIELHEDNVEALRAILHALASGDAYSYLRKQPPPVLARQYYIIADKYDMWSIQALTANELLPQLLDWQWKIAPNEGGITASEFKYFYYDFFNEHFSAVSGYPEDLWPLYAKAIVHYQRTEPGFDLFSYLLSDNPAMACGVARQLSVKLVATEDELEGHSTALASERDKVKDLTARCNGSDEVLATAVAEIQEFNHKLVSGKEIAVALNNKIDAIKAAVQDVQDLCKTLRD